MGQAQSRILRASSLVELLAAIVLAWWWTRAGVSWWCAVPVAAALPLAVHGFPIFLEFLVGALFDPSPGPRLGPAKLLRVWWRETWHSVMLFTIHQAWNAGFREPPLTKDSARPAVLLVHGYMCNRAAWRDWLPALSRRWNVATVNLEPVFGPIDRHATAIQEGIIRLCSATGARRVTLVCHSMGGLAARAYLRDYGADAVRRVVTIATPHYGTILAWFGQGIAARQMRTTSDYLRSLSRHKAPTELVCLAARHDNLIIPRRNQVLERTENVWFEKIGHLSMVASEAVLEKVIEIVERPPN
jgi:hypothetical protein